MKIFASYLALFLFVLAPLNASIPTELLPACCKESCCCTGADVCTGCACTGGPLEAKSDQIDDYPLTTCVVSGEDLHAMGEPITYWHKVDGQPDRMVLFCCERCQGRFETNPDKYLAMLDDVSCCVSADCCTDGVCSECGDCEKSCCAADGKCADCA